MASGDVLAFLQSDWVALWAATLHNSMYGNVPGLFPPYKIGLDAPGYMLVCVCVCGSVLCVGGYVINGPLMCVLVWPLISAQDVTATSDTIVTHTNTHVNANACTCVHTLVPTTQPAHSHMHPCGGVDCASLV